MSEKLNVHVYIDCPDDIALSLAQSILFCATIAMKLFQITLHVIWLFILYHNTSVLCSSL